ncbi:MAG: hypothetical protein ACK54F_04095 [Planctomycetia bacterium]
MPKKPSSTEPPIATPPAETVRAAVTVMLGLYFVGLALAVSGNSASGASALVRTIHTRLFSPWMTPPWLDLGYETKLTYGLPDDADHRIEVRRQRSPATARPLVLPADGMWGERARRWRRLARAAVIAEQDPDREALLPAAIGAGLFDDVGGDDLAIRILRDVRPDRAEVAAAGETPLRSEQAYAARVRRVDGELQLIKNEPQEELAPVIREPAP